MRDFSSCFENPTCSVCKSKHEELTEEEEMKQQQRMAIMIDLRKKIRSKGSMDAKNRWWVSELLAKDCEKTWIYTRWEDAIQKWNEWLEHMKKKDEKEKWRRCICDRWRRCFRVQKGVLDIFKNHKSNDVEVKCDGEIQNVQNKLWRNEELEEGEEALPRLKERDLEEGSRLYKAKTGVGCYGFHMKVPLCLTEETTGGIVEFLEKVEQSDKWPQQGCTTMFLLIPMNVTSERPIALMPTLIRWWEALRAPDVAKWQQKYRVDWDATDGSSANGMGILMEMESLDGRAKA